MLLWQLVRAAGVHRGLWIWSAKYKKIIYYGQDFVQVLTHGGFVGGKEMSGKPGGKNMFFIMF